MANFDKNRFDSKTTEWETPNELFEPLNQEFKFTLDVCATDKNKKVIKFISPEMNGLTYYWRDNICWMNPPYGKDLVKWLKKAEYEANEHGVTTVALIPARTNTNWWHDIVMKAKEVRFVRGRPKFNNASHGLPFPLAIVIFSSNSKPNI